VATDNLLRAVPATMKPLPQKPAAKLPWAGSGGEVLPDLLKIPDNRPDVLIFVKTPSGYVKAMEIDRNGESLFGTGEAAKNFTGVLTEAISSKLRLDCPTPEIPGLVQISDSIRHVELQLESRRKLDEFAALLLGIAIAAATISVLAFFIVSKMRGR
jgi:hypothetical protein